MNFEVSSKTALQYGVPRGSVLGPILFTIYTSQMGQIIDRDQIARQHFAYDTPCDMDEDSVKATGEHLEYCSIDVKTWMLQNRLKLSDDKIEVFPSKGGTK